MGLTDDFVDIKVKDKDPTLAYVENPDVKSKKELEMQRKEKTLLELKRNKSAQGDFLDATNRLKQRESCFLRVQYKENDGKTKKKVEEDRKKEMVEYNSKTFGKVAIGVHGKELPKFKDEKDSKVWWKLRSGFTSQPHWQSAKEMQQTNKFWAKNDDMLLSDIRDTLPP